MKRSKRIAGLGLVALTVAFTGCAPMASSWGVGPGLQLGLSSGGNLSLFSSQCSFMGSPGLVSPYFSASAVPAVRGRLQQANQVQAKYMSFSAGSRTYIEDWKSIAGGGC